MGSKDEFAEWYEAAQKDAGVYAKRFVKLYQSTHLCPHGQPRDPLSGSCTETCHRVDV